MPPSTIFCNVIQTKIKDKIVIENNNNNNREKCVTQVVLSLFAFETEGDDFSGLSAQE